ncbi:MAG: hypothetical protein U0793_10885 [Gemmataceae bacterium]
MIAQCRLLFLGLLFFLLSIPAAPAQEGKEPKPHKEDGVFKHLRFRLVGPAAGGRVSRATGVLDDPNTYYLGAASGGVWKSTDAGVSWKPIFDDQATASIGAIAVAPSDSNVIYVGSGEGNIRGNVQPGDGIYKSTDAGKTWKHVWKQKGQISHIVVHPKEADTAFAAVFGNAFAANSERGIYRTTDGGKTWQSVLSYKKFVKTEVTKVPFVPEVYDDKGMRVSGPPTPKLPTKDVVTEFWNYPAGGIDVCFDPGNPRVLYAALWQAQRTPWSLTSGGPGSGLYKSEDGGDTWKLLGPKKFVPLGSADKKDDKKDKEEPKKKTKGKKKGEAEDEDNGLPPGIYGRIGVAVAPSNSSRVFALIEAEKGGLYRSDDGGESWELVNSGRYLQQRAWYFSVVRVDPKNSEVVYVSNVRLLKSVDGGKTFKNVKGPHHPDHHDLWIDPNNPSRMIDSNDGGVDITTSGGDSWLAPMLPISQFYHVHADNSVPYRVMGDMQDIGSASGPSNSLKSGGIPLSDWYSVGGGEAGYAVPDPKDPNVVYSGEYMGIITRFDARTKQARNITIYPITSSGKGGEELKYRFQWTAPIFVSPFDRSVYHCANVVLRSKNQGKTWEKISPDLTRDDKSKQKWSGGPITGDNTGAEMYCTIFAFAESPLKQGLFWAGSDDGLVHVSRDNGDKWDNVTKNIPGLPEWGTVCCIEPGPRDPGVAYVVVDAHRLHNDRPYLWKTTDYGKTWKSLSDGLPKDDYLRVVRADPTTPGMLYAGSEHGLYVSWDDGATWKRLRMGLPTAAVSDLVVKDNDLVASTNGRSIWVFDDLTPLRKWSPKLEKEPVLFPALTTTRWRYADSGYGGEDKHPGANPPEGAVIDYYLPTAPKDDIVLEVLDAKGKLVRKVTSKKVKPAESEDDPDTPWSVYKPPALPKETGIQRFVWDLRATGPTVIPKAKADSGTPHQGFLVPPGKYALKLTVDGKTLEGSVEVRLDPRVAPPKAALKEIVEDNFEFATKVRDDLSAVSRTVIGLQAVRKQIKDALPLWEKQEAAKGIKADADKLIARLDALERKLHNPDAEVAYDILAKKGGAKLYSQLATLFGFLIDSDGPVTQGMRETYEEWSRELKTLEAEWHGCVEAVGALDAELRRRGVRHVFVPPAEKE